MVGNSKEMHADRETMASTPRMFTLTMANRDRPTPREHMSRSSLRASYRPMRPTMRNRKTRKTMRLACNQYPAILSDTPRASVT